MSEENNSQEFKSVSPTTTEANYKAFNGSDKKKKSNMRNPLLLKKTILSDRHTPRARKWRGADPKTLACLRNLTIKTKNYYSQ